MSANREIAAEYLRTPPGAPWRWEDGGRALVWQDGATVAFREELDAIFERLSPGGLPPFPVLVCLLAACRGRYLAVARPQTEGEDARQLVLSGLGGVFSQRSEQVAIEQLRKLAALPSDVIGHPRGKALLAQIVFEAQERPHGADAERVRKGLCAGLGAAELNAAQEGPDDEGFDLVATLHQASQPLRAHTAESLRMRLRTGLDAAPTADAVALALPRSERARRLLAKLAQDEEHGGLVLAVRDLMAAIRLPNVLARADEQAAGGASGLGNRGTLDRLLLSELAHDDITLATRVALNEALYLHREPPARRPRRDLVLLIDTGLRMWGVPRVLAAAAGLALLAGWPDEAEAETWRAGDANVEPVDLLDEKGLAAHLAVLGLALHPGKALPDFLARAEVANGRDVVVVTHRMAAQMEEFRRRLAEIEVERGFLVLVDHAGLVQLHVLPWGGEKSRPLAEVTVDLAKLTSTKREGKAKAASAAPLVNPVASSDLPAIFRESPFPLLLPGTGKLERTAAAGEGGLCVTSDRRLFSWTRAAHGARQVLADLPGGRTCLLQRASAGGQITVVRGRDGSGKMAVIGLAHEAAKPEISRVVGPRHPLGVFVDRTAILLVLHTRVAAVSLDASSLLGETPMPDGLRAIGGRYAVDAHDLWFVAWDGAQVRWDKTEMGRHMPPTEIVSAFERDGVGPWVVTRDGRVLSPAGKEWMRLDFPPALVTVLRVGNELFIQSAAKDASRHFVYLASRSSRPVAANRIAVDPAALLPPPSRQLHCRIDAIHAAPGQPLRLRNAKGRWLELFAQRDGLRLVTAGGAPHVLNREALKFEGVSAPAALGCALRRVSWPGGSAAWMDDRGLLHLRSANAEVPEFTLVLGVGIALAGWASDGMLWGPEFFIGKKDGAPTASAFALVERFSNSLC